MSRNSLSLAFVAVLSSLLLLFVIPQSGLAQQGEPQSGLTPPVTNVQSPSPNAQGYYPNPTLVTLSAVAADGYEVTAIYYKIDNAPFRLYSGVFGVSDVGSHTLYYYAVDNQGVHESVKTLHIHISVDGMLVPVEPIASIGGKSYALEVVGNYAYLGEGTKLTIVDVSDAFEPRPVSTLDFYGGVVNDIDVVNNYAFITTGNTGLFIVDLTDAESPLLVGQFDSAGEAVGVKVHGSYAYLAELRGGIHVIGISDLSNPVLLKSEATSFGATDLAISGNYLYSASSGHFFVFDVTDPPNIGFVGEYITSPRSMVDVSVDGNYAYIAMNDGFEILNIADPSNITLVSSVTNANPYGIQLVNSVVYIADDWGFHSYDVTTPALPRLTATYVTLGDGSDLRIQGGHLYLADRIGGLRIVSLADAEQPVEIGAYSTLGNVTHVTVHNRNMYLLNSGDGGSEFQAFDVSTPNNPLRKGSVKLPAASVIELSEAHAFAVAPKAEGVSQIIVLDVSDSTHILEVATIPFDTPRLPILDLAVKGSYLYVLEYYDGIRVFDISTPTNPLDLGRLDIQGYLYSITVYGDYAYVADNKTGSGLHIVDISSPSAPLHIGTAGFVRSLTTGVAFTGNYAYVQNGDYLCVVDATILANLVQLNCERASGLAAASPSYGYFLTDHAGVTVYTGINVVGRYTPLGKGNIFTDSANRLYVAPETIGGIQILQAGQTPVTNQPPTAEAGGPYVVDEGGEVSLTGQGTDPDGNSLTYTWDLDKDGTFETLGQTPSYSAEGHDGPSNQTVVLKVCDHDEICTMAEAIIEIVNAPPDITSVTNNGPIAEGGAAAIAITASDPAGAQDLLSYEFDCDNDGVYEVGPQLESSTTCTFIESGNYIIAVRVTDEDGGEDTDTTTVIVDNVAPEAEFANETGDRREGQTASLHFSNPSDPSPIDADAGFRYSYDCTGDGIFEITDSTEPTYSCLYPDNGNFAAKGRISDEDGGYRDYIAAIVVHNEPPIIGLITVLPNHLSQVNAELSFSANFTDAGVLDTHVAEWTWDDGTQSSGMVIETNGSGGVTGKHTYTLPGVYTVKLVVTDKDNGVGSQTYQFVVIYDPSAGFVTGGGWFDTDQGRAHFGLQAKYRHDDTIPIGGLNFRLDNLGLKAQELEWLVIIGNKAIFQGVGILNGAGHYGFTVTVQDHGEPGRDADTFRIRIWDQSSSNAVVYDSEPGLPDGDAPTTIIDSGNISLNRTTVTASTTESTLATDERVVVIGNPPQALLDTLGIKIQAPQERTIFLPVISY